MNSKGSTARVRLIDSGARTARSIEGDDFIQFSYSNVYQITVGCTAAAAAAWLLRACRGLASLHFLRLCRLSFNMSGSDRTEMRRRTQTSTTHVPPSSSASSSTMFHMSPRDILRYRYHHGANLGSIFVLERWLSPHMFPYDLPSDKTSELEAVKAWVARIGIERTRKMWENHWSTGLEFSGMMQLRHLAKCKRCLGRIQPPDCRSFHCAALSVRVFFSFRYSVRRKPVAMPDACRAECLQALSLAPCRLWIPRSPLFCFRSVQGSHERIQARRYACL